MSFCLNRWGKRQNKQQNAWQAVAMRIKIDWEAGSYLCWTGWEEGRKVGNVLDWYWCSSRGYSVSVLAMQLLGVGGSQAVSSLPADHVYPVCCACVRTNNGLMTGEGLEAGPIDFWPLLLVLNYNEECNWPERFKQNHILWNLGRPDVFKSLWKTLQKSNPCASTNIIDFSQLHLPQTFEELLCISEPAKLLGLRES